MKHIREGKINPRMRTSCSFYGLYCRLLPSTAIYWLTRSGADNRWLPHQAASIARLLSCSSGYISMKTFPFLWMLGIAGLALVGCSPPAEEPVATDTAEQAAESPDRYFDSDGVQIHYTDTGEGDPLILIHGFAMSVKRWESGGVVEALAEPGYPCTKTGSDPCTFLDPTPVAKRDLTPVI